MRFSRFIEKYNVEDLQKLFDKNLTIREVSKITSIPEKRLSEMTRYFNINVKRKGVSHTINHNFFSSIDSELSAYLLGFIVADGSISGGDDGRQKRLSFNNSIDDIEIITLLRDYLIPTLDLKCSNKSTDKVNRKDQVYFKLSSDKICNDLIDNHSILPKKTYDENFKIKGIPKQFFVDFLRGFLDGDGHFSKNSVDFISTSKDFLKQIQHFFSENGFESHRYYEEVGVKMRYYRLYININSSNRNRLFDTLYKNKKYFLSRKKNDLLNFISPNKQSHPSISKHT